MGPHHDKKIKCLIYPTLTFSALTTRLLGNVHLLLEGGGGSKVGGSTKIIGGRDGGV